MRAKVLTAVYAAIAVQRILLPVPQKLPTIADGASMLTEMVFILGVSVLASDVTAFFVGKVKGNVFDRPFSWPLRRSPTSAAPPTEASPTASPGPQPAGPPALLAAPVAAAPAGEAGGQSTLTPSEGSVAPKPGGGGGTFASTLASVAGAGTSEVSK